MDNGYIIAIVYDTKNNIIGYVILFFVNGVPTQKAVAKNQLIAAVKSGQVALGNARLIQNGFAGTLYPLTDLVSFTYSNGYKVKSNPGILAVLHSRDTNTVLLTAVGQTNGVYSMEFKTVPTTALTRIALINRNKETGKIELNTIGNKAPTKQEVPVKQETKPQPQVVREQPVKNETASAEDAKLAQLQAIMNLQKEKEDKEIDELLDNVINGLESQKERSTRVRLKELEEKIENPEEIWKLSDFTSYMKLHGWSYEFSKETRYKQYKQGRRTVNQPYTAYTLNKIDSNCEKFRTIEDRDFEHGNYLDNKVPSKLKWLMIFTTAPKVSDSRFVNQPVPPLNLDKFIIVIKDKEDRHSLKGLLQNAELNGVQVQHNAKEVIVVKGRYCLSDSFNAFVPDNFNIGCYKPIGTRVKIRGGSKTTIHELDLSNVPSTTLTNFLDNGEFLPENEEWDMPYDITAMYSSFRGTNVPKTLNIHSKFISINDSFNSTNIENINFVCDAETDKSIEHHVPYSNTLGGFNNTKIKKVNIPGFPKRDRGGTFGSTITISGFCDCRDLEEFTYNTDENRIHFERNTLCRTPRLGIIEINDKVVFPDYLYDITILRDSGAHVIFRNGVKWSAILIEIARGVSKYTIEDDEIDLLKFYDDSKIIKQIKEYASYKADKSSRSSSPTLSKGEALASAFRNRLEYIPDDILDKISSLTATNMILQNEFDTANFKNDVRISSYAFYNDPEALALNSELSSNYEIRKSGLKEYKFTTIALRKNTLTAFEKINDENKCSMFKGSIRNLGELTSIFLDFDNLYSIEQNAIVNCPLLSQIAICPSVQHIDGRAFNSIKNVSIIKVYVVTGSEADKYFTKKEGKFEVIRVGSMDEANELMFETKADPRKIAKYKLMLMNTEFGNVLSASHEDIWERTKNIYTMWLSNSSSGVNSNVLNESKFKAVRKLSPNDALMKVITKFRLRFGENLFNFNQGGDTYTKEYMRFNSLCNLITKISDMRDEYIDDSILNIFSDTETAKYSKYSEQKWGEPAEYSNSLGKMPVVSCRVSTTTTFYIVNEDFGYYHAKGEILYCSPTENSAIFYLSLCDKDTSDCNNRPSQVYLAGKGRSDATQVPTIIVIVKQGVIVYVTPFDYREILEIFGRQVLPGMALGVDKVFKVYNSAYGEHAQFKDNANLMQPGFSIFDTLDTGDSISFRTDSNGRLDVQILIDGHKLQPFDPLLTVKMLGLNLWANTIIIGVDPVNNILDRDHNQGAQVSEYKVLLYDLVIQKVIVCTQKRNVNKGTINTLGIGDIVIVEKITLDEAYEKYRAYFKYYDKAFFVGETAESSVKLYNLEFIRMAQKLQYDEHVDIEDREDKIYDINNSDLLVIGKKLADLGYNGTAVTLEMLLCALRTNLYSPGLVEVDADDVDDRYYRKLVMYGEIPGTNYEIVEYIDTSSTENPKYYIRVIDITTDIIKLDYTGRIEIMKFLQILYNGYMNVKTKDSILYNANLIDDLTVDGNDFEIFHQLPMTMCIHRLWDGATENYQLCTAIDKRNLDFYLIVKAAKGCKKIMRFNSFAKLKAFRDTIFVDDANYIDNLYECTHKMYSPERIYQSISQIQYHSDIDAVRHMIMRGYTDDDKVIISANLKATMQLCCKQPKIKDCF